MNSNKNCVSFTTAKLLKTAGWHLGSDHSYVKDAFLKDPAKKLGNSVPRVDDILYYCHAENDDGSKTYPDLKEEDWIKWSYVFVDNWWRNDQESYMRWPMYEAPLISEVLMRIEDEFNISISIFCNGEYKSYVYNIREFEFHEGTGWEEYHYEFGVPKKNDWYGATNEAIQVALKRIIKARKTNNQAVKA